MKREILLASGSPRRREILQNLGYTVNAVAADIDETPLAGEKSRSSENAA